MRDERGFEEDTTACEERVSRGASRDRGFSPRLSEAEAIPNANGFHIYFIPQTKATQPIRQFGVTSHNTEPGTAKET